MKTNNLSRRKRTKTRWSLDQRINFESLEERRLMTGDIHLDKATGVLYLNGGDKTRDFADIRIDTHGTTSKTDDEVMVSMGWQADFSGGGMTMPFSRSDITSIVFNGFGGNDKFNNHTSIPAHVFGGAGKDTLLGGSGNDTIHGGDNNDYIDGRLGDDKIYGGAGNDAIFGDIGNDWLKGGRGTDELYGGAGRDSLFGESGNDWLDGGPNTEAKMVGGTGADHFIDDTLKFPGNDFKSNDQRSTTHRDIALFDYNFRFTHNSRFSLRRDYFRNVIAYPQQSLNSKVLAYAQSHLNVKIGDGVCTQLVEEALKSAGAKPGSNWNQPGYYVWGSLVTNGEAMKPGDIIQFGPGATFHSGNSTLTMDQNSGHAGIIESVNGTTITILNQNMSGSPVTRTTLDLATKTRGSFAVYHPVRQ